MKTNAFLLKSLMAVLLIGAVVTSCKKDKDEEDNDTSSASDNAFAEVTFDDVKNISDEAERNDALSSYKMEEGMLSACATITKDNTSNPKTITIDFGASNCMCADEKNRRGKIIVSYTGMYRDSATVITITFDNYYVNDNKVEGSKTVTNNGHNASGNLSYTVSVQGSIILANNGGTITWNSIRTREWIEGEDTPLNFMDDVYSITGSANGTSAQGVGYTAHITSPLIKKFGPGCRHFVSGKIDFTPGDKATRTIDFGDGTCDNKATVTIKGNVFNIILK